MTQRRMISHVRYSEYEMIQVRWRGRLEVTQQRRFGVGQVEEVVMRRN
jgi:hypothetical protein